MEKQVENKAETFLKVLSKESVTPDELKAVLSLIKSFPKGLKEKEKDMKLAQLKVRTLNEVLDIKDCPECPSCMHERMEKDMANRQAEKLQKRVDELKKMENLLASFYNKVEFLTL